MTAYAGFYTDDFTDRKGNVLVSVPVRVYAGTEGTSLSTLYTDRTKSSTVANPLTTDHNGVVSFYAEPGFHREVPVIGGVERNSTLIVVPVDPVEDVGGEGGGAVASVNTQTGLVVLDADDVGADPTGTAAAAVATHSADTTAVHGITDTSVLATATSVASAITAHDDATAHGAVASTSKVAVLVSPTGTGRNIYIGLTSSTPFPTPENIGDIFFRPA